MRIHELVFTSGALAELVRRLSPPGGNRVRVPCGVSRTPDRWEWLVAGTSNEQREGPLVLAVRGTHPEVLGEVVRTAATSDPDGSHVILGVGIGPAAGHFTGLVRHDRATISLGAVRVVAPGLPRLSLGARPHSHHADPVLTDRTRYSRTIGALGEQAFDRLRALRIAVIGCGRTGSLVVDHVAAYGLAGLALIDPDVLESHNLGEMAGDLRADLGRPKVAAMAERVRRLGLGTVVTAVTAPVQALDALFALKAADVIVSCPDNPSARLSTACVAALYLKPVLDLGTGVVAGPTGRDVGLDVRWLLPGRCVSCIGGRTAATPDPVRLGSLRSLNTWAVGVGFTLLEQFVIGAVRDSVWVQADGGMHGVPQLNRVTLPTNRSCRPCALGGRGDAGLTDLGDVLRQVSQVWG